MPKRIPGGRVKKEGKGRHRVAAPPATRAVGRPAATAGEPPRAQGPVAAAPSRAPVAPPSPPSVPRQSLLAGVRRPARPSAPTLVTDYAYVMADLRRIGILAARAFALLIALTFVIR